MTQIPDDPIIRTIERTGYPPWWEYPDDDDFDEGSDGDVYYGNTTEDF
jgi:hypothetical protein